MLTTDSQPIYSNVGYRPSSGVRTSAPTNASVVSSPIRTVSTRPTGTTTTVSSPGSSGGLLNSASAIADAYSTVSKVGNFFTTPASEIGLSTGPISGAVNAFGANYLGLSPGVTGSTAVYGPLPAGTTGFVGPPAAAGPTLVGSLGAASLGYIGGGYLADLTGGNPLGGSIGGAVGAGAGYAGALSAVGLAAGPIGGLVAGVAGGLLGGAFGNNKSPNPAAALLKAPISSDGAVAGGTWSGKHIGADIPSSLQQEFSSVLKSVKSTTGVDLGNDLLVDFYYDPGYHGSTNSTRMTLYRRDPEEYEAALAEEWKAEEIKHINKVAGNYYKNKTDSTGNFVTPPENSYQAVVNELLPGVSHLKNDPTFNSVGPAQQRYMIENELAIAIPQGKTNVDISSWRKSYNSGMPKEAFTDPLIYHLTGKMPADQLPDMQKQANAVKPVYTPEGRAAEKVDKAVGGNIFFNPNDSNSRAKAYEQALQAAYGTQLSSKPAPAPAPTPTQTPTSTPASGVGAQQSNIIINRPQRPPSTTISSQSGETPFQKFRREFVENRNARTSRNTTTA